MTLSDIIHKITEEFMERHLGDTPQEINSGNCDHFADVVQRLAKKQGILTSWAEGYGHFWIFYNGKHYDAEAPEGVENWHLLPFYIRNKPLTVEGATWYDEVQSMEEDL